MKIKNELNCSSISHHICYDGAVVKNTIVLLFKKMRRSNNTNKNRSFFRSSLLYTLIFRCGIGHFCRMFKWQLKGPVADIYTEFMQSLEKGEIKELKCNIQTLFIRLLGIYRS